jgi:hypothetical protein
MKDHVSPFFLVVRSNYVYITIERLCWNGPNN